MKHTFAFVGVCLFAIAEAYAKEFGRQVPRQQTVQPTWHFNFQWSRSPVEAKIVILNCAVKP